MITIYRHRIPRYPLPVILNTHQTSFFEQIEKALQALVDEDGALFGLPGVETNAFDDAPDMETVRKLHEICINHKLAEKLAEKLIPLYGDTEELFVDIEFNKRGSADKLVNIQGVEKVVRPDIIFHNRKYDQDQRNILIVECKKDTQLDANIAYDIKKIKGLMEDPRFQYEFGLQVIYGDATTESTFFFKDDSGEIKQQPMKPSIKR